jgi:WD40 repeat protein
MELPSASVTGMDVCIRKPLVATSSLDKAVRLWNWQDATLELCKYFQDEAYSIAIHPNGLLLLVGFADKLRMMSILMDDLKVRCLVAMQPTQDAVTSAYTLTEPLSSTVSPERHTLRR